MPLSQIHFTTRHCFQEVPCPELSGAKENKHEIKHTRLADQVRARNVTWRGSVCPLACPREAVREVLGRKLSCQEQLSFQKVSHGVLQEACTEQKKESGILAICALRDHLPASGRMRLLAVCSSSFSKHFRSGRPEDRLNYWTRSSICPCRTKKWNTEPKHQE